MTREQVQALVSLHKAGGLYLLGSNAKSVGWLLSRWVHLEVHYSETPDFELVEEAIDCKVGCFGVIPS